MKTQLKWTLVGLAFWLAFAAQAATLNLTLAWTASPTPAVTYNVYRSVGVANFTLVAHTSALQAVVSYDDAVPLKRQAGSFMRWLGRMGGAPQQPH